jgi:hypothetical protein
MWMDHCKVVVIVGRPERDRRPNPTTALSVVCDSVYNALGTMCPTCPPSPSTISSETPILFSFK